MLKTTPLHDIITIPTAKENYATFVYKTGKNIESIFGFDDKTPAGKKYGFEQFLENDDHGVEHIYNVFKKANEIADRVETETGEKIDRDMLYVMIALHDSGRFHMEAPVVGESETEAKRKEKKAKRADSKHELYGVAQFNFGLAKLRAKGIDVDPSIVKNIQEYVFNHDYMNPQLNGQKYHEPTSLEGQVARLADRISTHPIPEIERYRATGKRMGTPYFNKDISFDDRKAFTFMNIGEYARAGKLDQFMFFATLLAVKAENFSHPILQEIYKQWTPEKAAAAQRIITLAQEENIDAETIEAMKKTIAQYSELYQFDF